MKTAIYTICDTALQKSPNNARNLDYAGFIKSLAKAHPNVDVITFDETDLQKHGLNYLNAKATLGRILSTEYDLVVNMDADHYVFEPLTEIMEADYDVACPANFNMTGNVVGINVTSGIYGGANPNKLVSEIDFLQGGLIASTSKQFWQHYEYASLKYWNKFHCAENDVLNLVAYLYPYKVKVLDGHVDYGNATHTQFYGCSIIGKEQSCYVENNRIMCEGKPVKAYHFAHGSAKKHYTQVFNAQVSEFIQNHILK